MYVLYILYVYLSRYSYLIDMYTLVIYIHIKYIALVLFTYPQSLFIPILPHVFTHSLTHSLTHSIVSYIPTHHSLSMYIQTYHAAALCQIQIFHTYNTILSYNTLHRRMLRLRRALKASAHWYHRLRL